VTMQTEEQALMAIIERQTAADLAAEQTAARTKLRAEARAAREALRVYSMEMKAKIAMDLMAAIKKSDEQIAAAYHARHVEMLNTGRLGQEIVRTQ
jgi:hypothetical protein